MQRCACSSSSVTSQSTSRQLADCSHRRCWFVRRATPDSIKHTSRRGRSLNLPLGAHGEEARNARDYTPEADGEADGELGLGPSFALGKSWRNRRLNGWLRSARDPVSWGIARTDSHVKKEGGGRGGRVSAVVPAHCILLFICSSMKFCDRLSPPPLHRRVVVAALFCSPSATALRPSLFLQLAARCWFARWCFTNLLTTPSKSDSHLNVVRGWQQLQVGDCLLRLSSMIPETSWLTWAAKTWTTATASKKVKIYIWEQRSIKAASSGSLIRVFLWAA